MVKANNTSVVMDRNTQQKVTVVALLVLLAFTHVTGLEVAPATPAVEEGDNFVFDCDGDISSRRWRLPNGTELGPTPGPAGARIQAQNRLLRFTPVMQGDNGTYVCFDGNNPSRSASARLEVYFPPHIQNYMPVQEIHLGQSVLIMCEVNLGNPIAELTWYKDNRIINQSDSRITVMDNGLKIVDVVESDSGEYRCFVHNEVGHDELTITVAFKAIPQFVNPDIDTTVTVLLRNKIELDCSAAGAPQPNYTWYSPAESSSALGPTNRDPYLTNPFVDVSDGGEYKCTAKNEVGEINRTFTVIIVAPPSPSLNYLNATVSLGEPVTLTCPVNGIPTPQIQWYFYSSETKREAPITENNRFTMKADGTLDITEFEASDFEPDCYLTLLCVGHNDYGESRQYYTINLTPSDCIFESNTLQSSIPPTPAPNDGSKITNITVIALVATGCSIFIALLVILFVGFLYFHRSCKKDKKANITVMTRLPQPPRMRLQASTPPNTHHNRILSTQQVQNPLPPTATSQNLQMASHTSRISNRHVQQRDQQLSSRLPQSYIPHSDPHLNASPSSHHAALFISPQQHSPSQHAHTTAPVPMPSLSSSPDRQCQHSHYGRLQHYPSHRNASLASTSSASSTTPLITQSSLTSSSSEDEPVFTEGEGNSGASPTVVSIMQPPHEGLVHQTMIPYLPRHSLTVAECSLQPCLPAQTVHSTDDPPPHELPSRAPADSGPPAESHATHLMSCPECMQQITGGNARESFTAVFNRSCPECVRQGLQRETIVEHRQFQSGSESHPSCLADQTPAESTLAHHHEQQPEYLQVVGVPIYETIQ